MWQHFVYIHRKVSTGEPFYVGKGRLHKGQPWRAHDKCSRNKIWHRTVAKHGLVVEVIMSCVDDKAAQEFERQLIKEIGRRDLGLGPLINLTDGGDGHAGLIIPDHIRRIRSEHAKKPRSQAWIASIRKARKDGGNGGVVKHGDKLPDAWRASLAASKRGKRNPYFGRPSPPSKKVVNQETGIVYDSIARAAAAEGVNAKTLYQYLDGTRPNRTALTRL
jgi:hypothetical protein